MSECKCVISVNTQRMRLPVRHVFVNNKLMLQTVTGVYAVANAFYLLSNVDISSRQLKESAVWEHFLQCIKLRKFAEFSQSEPTEIALYCHERSVKLDVFCICKLPWVCYHIKKWRFKYGSMCLLWEMVSLKMRIYPWLCSWEEIV